MALSKRAPRKAGGSRPRHAAERYGPKRLGALYEISKLLTHFVETIEQTVLTLLAIVTKELPIRSIVLIEKTPDRPKPVVWHAASLSASDRQAAERRAAQAFASLTGLASPPARTIEETTTLEGLERGRFMTFPLIIQGHPIFGALHLEGVEPFKEHDIEFVRAIADQLAIALDRYHARLSEIAMRKQAESSRQRAEREVAGREKVELEVRELNKDLERRVAERTAQFEDTIKELQAFTYSIAHDLRAPLRHIHGFSQLLLERASDKKCADYAQRIMSSSVGMDALIKDLLAYSRLTLEEVELEPVSLASVLAQIRKSLKDDLKERGAELRIEQPLPSVVGHGVGLTQAITNLISNALKFAAPGAAPRILVKAEPRGPRVRLWVEDNGIGIAPEHQERIFGVFQRLHRAEEYPGTGIGLAIVRRALERMKGQAGVESEPGRGSRFWIELEKAPAQA